MPKSAQFLPDADLLASDRGVGLDIRQCSGCGLVQINNEPVPYYKEVIRAVGISEEMKAFRLKQFHDLIKRFSLAGKKVIEIGCGRGEYLAIMSQCGVNACGLEYSDESVTQCRKIGLKVTKGFIDNSAYSLEGAPFDAFYILSFLEHLPDPNAALRGIFNNLVNGGVGLVEVPNFDMILRKNLFSEFITDHLFYFTRATLCFTLNLNGFEIIDCGEVWHDYIISAIVRKRDVLDISRFAKCQERIRREIEAYIGRYGPKKVAIWGAGHQALAVIALSDLGPKVKYVVDSAEFKQGKFTPGSHIPIVSPKMLELDPVAAVIIIAGSYSDEVAGIIRQRVNCKADIAILRDFGLEITVG
ncbi:MAG: methyltransferase domain-containing protein [Firmicutes bacterium]|nr:methyltransferase domain-containing protein [Bacillota bacterium]